MLKYKIPQIVTLTPLKECITIIKDRIIREIPYSKKVKERK